MSSPTTSLHVDIRDIRDTLLTDATVTLKYPGSRRKAIPLPFDARLGRYTAAVAPGAAVIEVTHPQLQAQTRSVQVPVGAPPSFVFILGAPGVKTYFREKVRVPVDADADLIAVTLARKARRNATAVDTLASSLGLQPEKVSPLALRSGVRLYRVSPQMNQQALSRFMNDPQIEHAGAVVSLREHGLSHLTRDVVVCFRGPRHEAVRQIARELGYTLARELVYAPGTYVLRWNQPATLDLLDSIEKLAARDDVAWAEPSLVVTPEVDAVTPTDPLWSGLWDRQLIAAQDAWQALQDAGLDTFGDPDIVLAVWDSGVQSTAGVPRNADFAGTLSDGSTKVEATFDFDNMVANNDAPWDDHGSGVAGVSTALANNPSPVAGESYGLVGSAPNVRIMTVAGRTPYIDIEVADQYVWMAGFDPQSPLPGFPAAPPTRGADVITCSLTPGAGAPLSGTARATLDFVTTYGRGGKGTMCFFSTGNANQNNVTARPYGAYEKCFGIAATSFANDGVTEIRAPYSGWGQIALCAPSQDQSPTVHNPPTGFMPWGAAHEGQGNLISFRQTQTTLAAASVAGATVLSVASVAGFAVNAIIHIGNFGAPGSEPARISAVNAGTHQLTVAGYSGGGFAGGLLNAHAAGAPIATGPANHRNNFGGTSSATPLCAGVAALVLSANPGLTYIEAREILRNTAVKFDLANVDPVGRWLDADGNPTTVSGLPPVRSGWYGWGRVNAAAAVQAAIDHVDTRDMVIRDNLADTGTVASSGAFWNSPDIWCRRLPPGSDPGALPASHATAGPHEDPLRGVANWVYARVRNNGTSTSLDGWVRLSVTHFPGLEFTYPASFQPSTGPGDPVPSPMVPGTYFIGEAKFTAVPPGGEQIVSVEWPAGLIPPAEVVLPSGPVHWHPCLLAEVTPHDGPIPTGNHVWDDNNLAQKNISIVDVDTGADFAAGMVIGHPDNKAEHVQLEILRGNLPGDVQLYVDLVDPLLRRRLRQFGPATTPGHATPPEVRQPAAWWLKPAHRDWRIGHHDGREVVFLKARPRVRLPIPGGANRLSLIVVGGLVNPNTVPGPYEVVLIQRQPDGHISGSATVSLRVGKGSPT